MKTDMHINSLETFDEIMEALPMSRAYVLGAIRQHQPITRQGIAAALEWPINRVTGRVRELLDVAVIEETGTTKGPGGKPRSLLSIKVRGEPQADLFV
jgi:hypothetical protein